MIWDRVLDAGGAMGIIPCRFITLAMLRVESYLHFCPHDKPEMYPFENACPGDTLWKRGLDFTVSTGGGDRLCGTAEFKDRRFHRPRST